MKMLQQFLRVLVLQLLQLMKLKMIKLLQTIYNNQIDETNTKVISKAHCIRKWILIPGDLSVDGGELTPTLKLKRRVVEQKWIGEIDKIYQDAKL